MLPSRGQYYGPREGPWGVKPRVVRRKGGEDVDGDEDREGHPTGRKAIPAVVGTRSEDPPRVTTEVPVPDVPFPTPHVSTPEVSPKSRPGRGPVPSSGATTGSSPPGRQGRPVRTGWVSPGWGAIESPDEERNLRDSRLRSGGGGTNRSPRGSSPSSPPVLLVHYGSATPDL